MTSDPAGAIRAVTEAIHAIGGTGGAIQSCQLSWLGCYYLYGPVVAHAERDEASGTIVWRDELDHAGTSVSEMPLAVREAIACLPVTQNSIEFESTSHQTAAVDLRNYGDR
ncbi:hypothetical protein [Actinomadura alba]|uniref:Uncharacterized protein n=1 Tax=Actinomadura alba TaxID=406431 RepID=A0ABR7LQJ2_9ACTN|nr:hypothetical protein [Actinomadura alba]MBC6466663.1 hypothetical protein [Actinomadura alba]